MKAKFFILLITVFSIGLSATAQPKKQMQKKRVVQGVKSGQVTKKEAAKIRQERLEAKEEVKEAKANGTVTQAERKSIIEERKEASKVIKRAKHNAKKRN